MHVARYDCYYETVFIGNMMDDVRVNVRRNLDVTRASNYRLKRPQLSPGSSMKGALR